MNCSRHAIKTYTIQHFWNRHIMHVTTPARAMVQVLAM